MLKILMFIIIVEALVELICKSEILERPREWIKSWGWFTNDLLSCYYCTSVWVGMTIAPLYFVNNKYLYIICLGIALHRLSNYLHLLFGILRDFQIDTRIRRGRQ